MERLIERFTQDDEGDWVAHLECLHRQHVRHQPPFRDRPWVVTAEGRQGRIGTPLDCPLCDRTELPDDLVHKRTAGPWDAGALPAALRRDHRVGHHTWGVLRVLDGEASITLQLEPPLHHDLRAGEHQNIPPGVAHAVDVRPGGRIEVEFFSR